MEDALTVDDYGEARQRKFNAFLKQPHASSSLPALRDSLSLSCRNHRLKNSSGSLSAIYKSEWPTYVEDVASNHAVDDFEDLEVRIQLLCYLKLIVKSMLAEGIDNSETLALQRIVEETESKYKGQAPKTQSETKPVFKGEPAAKKEDSFIAPQRPLKESKPSSSFPLNAKARGRPPARPQANTEAKKSFEVGPSVQEKFNYFQSVLKKWDVPQLVHEFTGRNLANWEAIVKCQDEQVTEEVLRLLSKNEVAENVLSGPLFKPLLTHEGYLSLSVFLREGVMSSSNVEFASENRGGPAWNKAVAGGTSLLSVLTSVFRFFSDAKADVGLLDLVELLTPRIHKLCPKDPSDSMEQGEVREDESFAYMAPWDRRCVDEMTKTSCCTNAQRLLSLLNSVTAMQNFGIALKSVFLFFLVRIMTGCLGKKQIRDRKLAEEQKAIDSASERRGNRKSFPGGFNFLNDPQHDSDFMSIEVIPSAEELVNSTPAKLPQNLVFFNPLKSLITEEDDDVKAFHTESGSDLIPAKFQYRSFHHYLNTHFLLLREDCMAELRRGLACFRERVESIRQSKPKLSSNALLQQAASESRYAKANTRFNVYLNVKIVSFDETRQGVGFVVSFDVPSKKKVDWTRSSRFMNGSLLCLSTDGSFGANTIIIATVLKPVIVPDKKTQDWHPTITIAVEPSSLHRMESKLDFTMIESPVFFEAYRPVLQALQNLGSSDTHFTDILLGKTRRVDPPLYLQNHSEPVVYRSSRGSRGWNFSGVFPEYPENADGEKVWDPLATKGILGNFKSSPALDKSQRDAIALALSKRLAIIQGPPGCGKTFIGVIITRLLLENRHLRGKKPIMFVCQTNHALDQILEHVYNYEESIIRIGGRSESAIMQQLNLQTARDRFENDRSSRRIYRTEEEFAALKRSKDLLAQVKSELAQMMSSDKNSLQDILNCNLARLWRLLKSSTLEYFVDEIVKNASRDVQYAAFDSVKNAFLASGKRLLLPPYLNDFDEWCELSSFRKLILLATYTSRKNPSVGGYIEGWIKKASSVGGSAVFNPTSLRDSKDQNAAKVEPLPDDEEVEDMELNLDEMKFRTLDDEATSESNYSWDEQCGLDLIDEYNDSEWPMSREERSVLASVYRYNANNIFDSTLSTTFLASAKAIGIDKLNRKDCEMLSRTWATLLEKDASGIGDTMRMYQDALGKSSAYFGRVDATLLKEAAVIGMTTNGAAKYANTLQALGVEVLIVEEAAEVLEASIVASITNATKHIILIGDHLQLRPQVNEYGLAKDHNLSVSLFERLISTGVPHVSLTTQRRMHPDISSLITPAIYPRLEDDASVFLRDRCSIFLVHFLKTLSLVLSLISFTFVYRVRGVADRLFFIDHQVFEDSSNSPSDAANEQGGKSNRHEAQFLVRLAQHLIFNGYEPSQIVIISMYKEQLRLIREEAKLLTSSISLGTHTVSDVRVTTTDNYQGEECDIVLLSLVRSNKEGKAGFVTIPNRVNVALSRARDGMYVVGNFSMIRSASKLWDTICEKVSTSGRIGPALMITCENHKEHPPSAVYCSADFAVSPHGGCMRQCGGKFETCGHTCRLLCHLLPHSSISCTDICEKPRPPGCMHPCRKTCGEICGPCPEKVVRTRTLCGHRLHVRCGDDVEDAKCTHPCPFTMACGHSCSEICAHNHSSSFKCRKKCSRTRLNCLHGCPKQCWEPCDECNIPVQRQLPCGHTVDVPCSVDVTTLRCSVACEKKLSCGHVCSKLCSETCDEKCLKKVLKPVLNCLRAIPHQEKLPCWMAPQSVPCSMPCQEELPCKHPCTGKCSDCRSATGKVDHSPCKKPCSRRLLCNHKCPGKHSCSTLCPPCDKPCELGCSHGSCVLPCSFPCAPCAAVSDIVCCHREDSQFQLCGEIIEPCEERCSKLLACNHPCLGFCGEVCPPICSICMPNAKEFKAFKNLKKNALAGIRFLILRCTHVFEVGELTRLVEKQMMSSKSILCCPSPGCFRPLCGTVRFHRQLKDSIAEVQPTHFARLEKQFLDDFKNDMKAGRFELLVDRLKNKLAGPLIPSHVPIVEMMLGEGFYRMEDSKEAEYYLHRALTGQLSDKNRATVLFSLGRLYLKENSRLPDAAMMLESAAGLDPNSVDIAGCLKAVRDRLSKIQQRIEAITAKEKNELENRSRANESSTATNSGPLASTSADKEAVDVEEDVSDANADELIDSSGSTAVHWAVAKNRVSDLKKILSTYRCDAFSQDMNGDTRKIYNAFF